MNLHLLPLVVATAVAPFTCSPLAEDWGLDAVNHLSTPPDPPLACGFTMPADPALAERQACAFGTGALAGETLGVTPTVAGAIPIRHVVVMMKENRSFDHLFGNLHLEGQPDADAEPQTYANPDLTGAQVFPFHETTTCVSIDPNHQSAGVATCLAGGAMNGFVINAAQSTGTDGHAVIGNYDAADLPFYFWLASTYALSDRHFAPMASGTFANRNFLLFGQNAGVVDTGITYPDPATPSILQLLLNAGLTWGAYSDSQPFSGALGWDASNAGVHPFQEFLDALDQGTLPNVAFVDGVENLTDDHPFADLQAGEAWTREIYEHALTSPQWQRLAILWTYDEAGAFADHVFPPQGCLALPSTSPFTRMGPRVPLVAISPWAKPHYVSHVVHDHTAITRFIETVFGLPALTARDANSDALLDLFDFSCERAAAPSPGPGPDAGVGGCAVPPNGGS